MDNQAASLIRFMHLKHKYLTVSFSAFILIALIVNRICSYEGRGIPLPAAAMKATAGSLTIAGCRDLPGLAKQRQKLRSLAD